MSVSHKRLFPDDNEELHESDLVLSELTEVDFLNLQDVFNFPSTTQEEHCDKKIKTNNKISLSPDFISNFTLWLGQSRQPTIQQNTEMTAPKSLVALMNNFEESYDIKLPEEILSYAIKEHCLYENLTTITDMDIIAAGKKRLINLLHHIETALFNFLNERNLSETCKTELHEIILSVIAKIQSLQIEPSDEVKPPHNAYQQFLTQHPEYEANRFFAHDYSVISENKVTISNNELQKIKGLMQDLRRTNHKTQFEQIWFSNQNILLWQRGTRFNICKKHRDEEINSSTMNAIFQKALYLNVDAALLKAWCLTILD